MLCEQGFSTYTSLPAWQAQIVISECQWFGVAIETASTFLSSRTLRMSFSVFGSGRFLSVSCLIRPLYVRESGSTRYTTSTFGMPPNSPTWEPARPLSPATATRTVSLAPSTRPDDLVPAMVTVAAVARVDFKNERRVTRAIEKPPAAEGGWERAVF